MTRLSFMLLCTVSAALCFSACSFGYNPWGLHFDQAQYDRELHAWNDSGVKNYTYRVEGNGSSTGPFKYTVVVKGGVPYSINGGSMDDAKYCGVATVSQMFADISSSVTGAAEWLDRHDGYLTGVEYQITYDPQYHYPLSFESIYHYSGILVNGGGGSNYTLSDFAVLK